MRESHESRPRLVHRPSQKRLLQDLPYPCPDALQPVQPYLRPLRDLPGSHLPRRLESPFDIEAQIGQFELFFLGRSTPQEKQGLPLFTWLRSCSPVCTPTSLHSLVHSTPPLHVNIGSVVPALQLLHLLPINPDQPHHRQTRIRYHRLLSCCRGGGHSGLLACGARPPIAARRGSVRRHSP